MLAINEYLYTGLFFLATGILFSWKWIGAAIVLLLLGLYFPHRAMMNELFNTIRQTNLKRKQKIFLYISGFCISTCPLSLVVGLFWPFGLGSILILLVHGNMLLRRR